MCNLSKRWDVQQKALSNYSCSYFRNQWWLFAHGGDPRDSVRCPDVPLRSKGSINHPRFQELEAKLAVTLGWWNRCYSGDLPLNTTWVKCQPGIDPSCCCLNALFLDMLYIYFHFGVKQCIKTRVGMRSIQCLLHCPICFWLQPNA